jgi:antitoxin component of MazEF toxin-antitoxin module
MQIAQSLGTDGQLVIKTDVLVDYLADKLGVPASVRNTAAERAVLMEEMRNQQQQQAIGQAMAMQAQAGGGMQALPAPEGAM